jgi:hypothetical protein
VAVAVAPVTTKDWVARGATFQLPLPAWSALMVQGPGFLSDTLPSTSRAQTACVAIEKVTASPELAVAIGV